MRSICRDGRSRGRADAESSLLCLVGTGLYRHDVAADVLSVGRPTCPSARFANKWGQMADDQNEKPQVVRFPEPVVVTAREAEEGRRVAEIAREIEEWDLDLLAQRLTARQNAETEADARKAAEEKWLRLKLEPRRRKPRGPEPRWG